ncbi:concanavalin A-like lectin/glucanase [Crucibulum laeve]|uniref:Concanavalin A-like lectin/glucanase n=1 Tax=Crucibulum laeve TaxID=68775 RepID=A0A5C3MFJ2_9AGAR|nr:concanavalin A-like lectin/glucanase [Crucibulum laeve]
MVEKRATCDTYVVSGIPGGFQQRVYADFSSATSGGDVATLLSQYGLSISDYSINGSPVPHTFTPNNAALGAGTLNLKVSAYSGSGAVQSAEVVTDTTFKYASVRTVMKSSTTPGIVEGNFFYLNDNQEIDFEILTSTVSQASSCVPAGIWATNQALTAGGASTHQTIPFTFNPTQAFHEYRIDWSSSATTFYIDGQQKAKLTSNIPTAAGHWIWNVWSNGDLCWSNGPPTANSITQIRSIDIYKGYTSTVSGNICNV